MVVVEIAIAMAQILCFLILSQNLIKRDEDGAAALQRLTRTGAFIVKRRRLSEYVAILRPIRKFAFALSALSFVMLMLLGKHYDLLWLRFLFVASLFTGVALKDGLEFKKNIKNKMEFVAFFAAIPLMYLLLDYYTLAVDVQVFPRVSELLAYLNVEHVNPILAAIVVGFAFGLCAFIMLCSQAAIVSLIPISVLFLLALPSLLLGWMLEVSSTRLILLAVLLEIVLKIAQVFIP